jgi:hypothetical protein
VGSYTKDMKASLFSVALIGSLLVTSACLAAERARTPAHAPEGHAGAHAPEGHAVGHETTGPGGSKSSVQPAPGAASEHPGAEGHDKGVSQAPKPAAGTPAASPTHAHGPRQSIERNSRNENARSPSGVDTRITVNQGRTGVNNSKGFVHRQEAPVDNGRRVSPQTGVHVPHSLSRPRVVPGPTRNAIGVTPDANAGTRRIGTAPFPGVDSARGPAAATRNGTYSPGIRPPGGAPAAGGAGSGTSTLGARMGRPIGIPGSAGISGAGMARGGLRVGEIGGPAKSTGGISGTSVRAKRP